ncbi:unnamed protein product [Auanema sp. JU1783]|nr:unnamed protein product [Auanema sp. JU1783]
MRLLLVLLVVIGLTLARPHFNKENVFSDRDYDYRLYEDDSSGVVIDRALPKHHHHHHHRQHHHKNYLKTNRMDGVRSFFDSFRL